MKILSINTVDYDYPELSDNEVVDINPWSIKLVDGDFYEGETVVVELSGKQYKRRVYYGRGELYIVINGYKYFKSDIE